MHRIVVYLAGGMRSGWQEKVIRSHANNHGMFLFIDPRLNDAKEFSEYSVLDLHHIKNCDIVFAYLEKENPGGAALHAECGYAKGLGKTVILVNEKQDKYMQFVKAFADICFSNLEDAINFLAKLQA